MRPSVTINLQSRIDQYYHYKWALHGGVQGENNLFADLHPQLRNELMAAEVPPCDTVYRHRRRHVCCSCIRVATFLLTRPDKRFPTAPGICQTNVFTHVSAHVYTHVQTPFLDAAAPQRLIQPLTQPIVQCPMVCMPAFVTPYVHMCEHAC